MRLPRAFTSKKSNPYCLYAGLLSQWCMACDSSLKSCWEISWIWIHDVITALIPMCVSIFFFLFCLQYLRRLTCSLLLILASVHECAGSLDGPDSKNPAWIFPKCKWTKCTVQRSSLKLWIFYFPRIQKSCKLQECLAAAFAWCITVQQQKGVVNHSCCAPGLPWAVFHRVAWMQTQPFHWALANVEFLGV